MIETGKKHKHIHVGILVFVICALFFLYKVNIESTIASPRFQNDVVEAKASIQTMWQKYVGNTLHYIWVQIIHPTDKSITIQQPVIDDKAVEEKVQPVKVRTYFGNTSEETVQQIADPSKKF